MFIYCDDDFEIQNWEYNFRDPMLLLFTPWRPTQSLRVFQLALAPQKLLPYLEYPIVYAPVAISFSNCVGVQSALFLCQAHPWRQDHILKAGPLKTRSRNPSAKNFLFS
jgi:hypothetical protein